MEVRNNDNIPSMEELVSECLKEKEIENVRRQMRNYSPQTLIHCQRTTDIVIRFCEYLKKPEDFIKTAKKAGMLHDIGKLHTPRWILDGAMQFRKEESKTPESIARSICEGIQKSYSRDEQKKIMDEHSKNGFELVKEMCPECAKEQAVLDAILYHHASFDPDKEKGGYVCDLKGKEIPEIARILSICDTYEACISDRTYKDAMTPEDALHHIIGESPLYDPELKAEFISFMEQELEYEKTCFLPNDAADRYLKIKQAEISAENKDDAKCEIEKTIENYITTLDFNSFIPKGEELEKCFPGENELGEEVGRFIYNRFMEATIDALPSISLQNEETNKDNLCYPIPEYNAKGTIFAITYHNKRTEKEYGPFTIPVDAQLTCAYETDRRVTEILQKTGLIKDENETKTDLDAQKILATGFEKNLKEYMETGKAPDVNPKEAAIYTVKMHLAEVINKMEPVDALIRDKNTGAEKSVLCKPTLTYSPYTGMPVSIVYKSDDGHVIGGKGYKIKKESLLKLGEKMKEMSNSTKLTPHSNPNSEIR